MKQANGHRTRIDRLREVQRDNDATIKAYDRAQIEAIFEDTIGLFEGILAKHEEDERKGRRGAKMQK